MNREYTLYALVVLLVAITALHFVGLERFWYWSFWWFDLITHFLFGFWVGLFALWVSFLSGYAGVIQYGRVKALVGVLIVVGVIGVGWEVFEVWAGIPVKEGHAFDTALDLLLDLFGALASFLFFNSSWIHKT